MLTWAAKHQDAPMSQHIMVAVSILILAICMAYAALKLYDELIHEWLNQNVLIGKKNR
jgi:cytochrome c oxidase assembly protein Cox11